MCAVWGVFAMDELNRNTEQAGKTAEGAAESGGAIVDKIPGRDVYETVSSLVSALLAVVLVFTFLVRMMGVEGPSMIPTLQDGDRLLVVNSTICGDYRVGDIVIARKHGGIGETITVRRISYGVGCEKVFPLHSPNVAMIETVRKGKVRRAKLYYLRDRVGKAAKIREKL